MPAFQAQGGMPYWIDLRSSDLRKSSYFYRRIFGWEITPASSDGSYLLARKSGLPVAGIMASDGSAPDSWVSYFLADDIEQLHRDVATAGGRVIAGPVNVQLGAMSVAADANGGLFGLIEPAGEDAFVAGGEPGTVVWHDYSATSGFTEAIDFYREVFGWQMHVLTSPDDEYGYATALAEGAPFAGVRDASSSFGAEVPSFWQSFLGVGDIALACRITKDLGGEVIRKPFDSEFGRLAIIADSTGATLTLCEVEEPVDEYSLSESDDLFHL